LIAIQEIGQDVTKISSWPFDTGILARLAVIVLSVIAIILSRVLAVVLGV